MGGAGGEWWDIRVQEARKGKHPDTSWAAGPRLPPNTPFQDHEPFTEEKTQGSGRAEQAIGTLLCSKNVKEGPGVHPQVPRATHRPSPQSVSQQTSRQPPTTGSAASMQQKESRESQQPGLNTATAPPPRHPARGRQEVGAGSRSLGLSPALQRAPPDWWGREVPHAPSPRQTQNSGCPTGHTEVLRRPRSLGELGGLQPGSPGVTGAARPQREECPPAQAPWGGHCCQGHPSLYSRSEELQMGKRPAGDYGLVGPRPRPQGRQASQTIQGPNPRRHGSQAA